MRTRARLTTVLVLLGAISAARRSGADARSGALEHFRIGIELVERKQWDSALAEFLRSRELYPTPSALENAAVCLRDLGRADEALDMYDELLERFGATLAPATRKSIDADMARIGERVGTLSIESDFHGASVLVDDRQRGRTPLAKPIRLTAGTRAVRVLAEGHAPFETRAEVSAGRNVLVTAVMPAVARVGSVRVVEASERIFEVLIDGGVVGRTPWEGTLAAGRHTFALRGENDVGSPARADVVRIGERTTVTLVAQLLPGVLRIEPTPAEATLYADGRAVARGTWNGSLPSGEHALDLTAPWSEPMHTSVRVSSERPVVLRPSLERIRRFYAEILGGPVFGDGRAKGVEGCTDLSCMGNLGGGRLGLMLTRAVGVDAFAYLFNFSRRSDDASIRKAADLGVTMMGGSLQIQLLDRTPLVFRFGAGVAYGTERTGSSGHAGAIETQRSVSRSFVSALVMHEVRWGYRISRALTVDVGVGLALFVLQPVGAEAPGEGPSSTLPLPTISRGVAYAVPITLGLRLFL